MRWVAVLLLAACGRIGFDPAPTTVDPVATPQIAQLTVGWRHACVRGIDGSAFCWGDNTFGQLGNGTDGPDIRAPTATATTIAWADLSAGETHTCGLDGMGSAYCWGTNGNHQLGLGDDGSPKSIPTPLGDGRTYRRIFAGSRHTCAIAMDRTLWCWGRNGARQLGIGGNVDAKVPTQAKIVSPQTGPDDQWASVGPGDDHTCALQLDGSAWCWGSEVNGQLGVGDVTPPRDSPQRVMASPAFIAVAAGRNYSAGIAAGVVHAWGLNNYGQLGLGDQLERRVPTNGAGANHTVVSAGVEHACARRADNSLACWGNGSNGQIGNGQFTSKVLAPASVPGQWLTVGAGFDFTCALDINQAVWCWGIGTDGRLGTGDTSRSPVPIQITGEPT